MLRHTVLRTFGIVTIAGLALSFGMMPAGATSTTSSSPPPVSNTPPPTSTTTTNPLVAADRAAVEGEIRLRQSVLAALSTSVSTSGVLTANESTQLSQDVSTEQQSMTTLLEVVGSDTTTTEIAAAHTQMIDDNYVFDVMAPKVHVTEAAQREIVISGLLSEKEPVIGRVVAALNSPSATATFQNLSSEVAAAQQLSEGVPTIMLSIQPRTYLPSGPTQIATERTDVITARSDLAAATADLHTIMLDVNDYVPATPGA